MTWISSLNGPTKGEHQEVPKELLEEAEKLAKESHEDDEDEETKADEGEKMEE
jgi:20S proteasome subunit alpha 7